MLGVAGVHRFVAWAERNHRAVLGSLVALELVIGLAYSSLLGPELRYWDEREYVQLATTLVHEHAFRYSGYLAFRPPLYPLVLAGARALGAPIVGLRVLNFVFLAGTMLLLDRIASAASRPFAGLVAAAWVLLDPVMVYTAGTLYPQTLAGLLLVAFVALVVREAHGSLAAAGLVFSLLVLAVPSFAPLLPVTVGWLWCTRRSAFVRGALELCAAAALPVATWAVRDHAVLGGQWVFVATNSGLNLLYGNCDGATPSSGVNADISRFESVAATLGEVDRDHYFRQMAIDWIFSNPWRAGTLYLGKLLHYFSSNDRLATTSETSVLRTAVATVAYAPLAGAFFGRALLARRCALKPSEVLLLLLYATNALLAAVFFTRVRLRVPADYLLLPLIGTIAAWLAERRRGGYS